MGALAAVRSRILSSLTRLLRRRRARNGRAEPQVMQDMTVIRKSDEEWKVQLSPEEFHVLREAGTEAPWSGEYVSTKTVGVYACRACGAELFRSDTKFDSHCGWPSFYQPTESDAVKLLEDATLGM